jgi:hypothetical protein
LSVGFCFLGLGTFGLLVPDLPGDPVNDFLNRSFPTAMCGDTTVAMFPDDVAPAVACSLSLVISDSLILFVLHITKYKHYNYED